MINYSEFSNVTNSFVDSSEEFEETPYMSVEEAELYINDVDDDFDGDLAEGKVSAAKIYLREGPSKESKDLTILERGEELLIDLAKSTDEWYSVCTATGIEGYVMKTLVEI